MRKSVRKTLLTLARATLPTLGFGFTCLGVFLLSTKGGPTDPLLRAASAYICIVLGFLLLVVGVLWAICLGVRSKVFLQRQRRRPRHNSSPIFTVDRPDFYPPSYEESFGRDVGAVSENTWVTVTEPCNNVAPPLYTASITEIPSEDYSSESPPTYTEAICQGRSLPETQVTSPAPTATQPITPLDGH